MTGRNPLSTSPPYPVDKAIKNLGANLRIARLSRNLAIQDVADKIGTGPRAVADAEKGKPSTGIAVYVALLWTFGLLGQFAELAAPDRDEEGLALTRAGKRQRARQKDELDNDF